MREPKVLMALPYRLIFGEDERTVGGLSEDFFAEMMGGPPNFHLTISKAPGAKKPLIF